jgi:hypothetical protein
MAKADFLDAHVLLVDPGWIYTEGSFGKFKGPVPIDFGTCHILQPLIQSIKNTVVNAQLFRRSQINGLRYTNDVETTVESFRIELHPCKHIVNQYDYQIIRCPICEKCVDTRKIISNITKHKKNALSSISQLPLVIIDLIMEYDDQ